MEREPAQVFEKKLHILCHTGAGSSLATLIWNEAGDAGHDALDAGRLGNLLAKHRRRLRLVAQLLRRE